jgi:hypothetical protein
MAGAVDFESLAPGVPILTHQDAIQIPPEHPCSPSPIDARSIAPVADAYAQAGTAAPIAIARALNWTGNKARTQVARTLARDTGVGYGVIRNALRTTPASPANLTYEIGVSDAHIPLAEFHARQTRRGVSAAPWGQRRVFPHTFIVEQLGGQVFKREGGARLPQAMGAIAADRAGARRIAGGVRKVGPRLHAIAPASAWRTAPSEGDPA